MTDDPWRDEDVRDDPWHDEAGPADDFPAGDLPNEGFPNPDVFDAESASDAVRAADEPVVLPSSLGTDEQITEWFSVEDGLSRDDGPEALPRRRHHVTTIVVAHEGDVWLPAVLTTLAHQTRPTDDVIGVDAGSHDGSLALLRDSLGEDRVVNSPENAGFGAGVAAGVALHDARVQQGGMGGAGDPGAPTSADDVVSWVWLLHDDSAPDVTCLSDLLTTADDHPSATVLGPKILGWHDRRLLLEAGVTISGSGRRVTGLERREHDQGQHDGARDVMAVSSAGMLVRRDVWDRLEGFDPTLPLFRDDLDFCWRAHRADERVFVATDAVIHHREASAHGRRADDLAPRPHRADREAAVHVLLAHAATWAAPFVALRLIVGSLARALVYLLGKDVVAARDEVSAVLALALHPSKVRSSRDLIRRTTTLPASVARHLRPSVRSQVRQVLEMVGGIATTSGSASDQASVSGLDSGPVGEDVDFLADDSSGLVRRLLTAPSFLLTVLLVVIAVIGTRGLWLGEGVLQGGALFPAPPGAGDLWQTYLSAWHDVGPGSTTPAPPYLAVVTAVAVLLLGKAPTAVTVILLLGIPLAGIAAYVTMRGLVPQKGIRFWAAAAYALLPAMTGAVASGRIGTTILAIALPFALRSLVRISAERGTYRRAAGTALLVAIVMSVSPGVWLLLVVGGVVAGGWLVLGPTRRRRAVLGRLAIGLLAPVVLLLPWSGYVLTHPSLILLEPGLNGGAITDPGLAPWHVLLLHPGGPGMTPVWISVGIVVAGLLALLRRDRLHITGGFAVLGALALAFGYLQLILLVTPPGATSEVRPWPGQATLVLGLALIAMAAVAVQGLRDRFVGTSFTLGQPVALLVAVGALLAPVLTAGWYATGLSTVMTKAPASPLPAFVAADSLSAQAPRSLIIASDAAGRVRYSLLNGEGPHLGDAETGPPAEVWETLDPYVSAMVSGRGGDEVEALAGYGVRYVVMAEGTSTDLVSTLDAEPGLRRLSSSDGEVLWRVSGVTTRARVASASGPAPVGIAAEGTRTADPYISQILPEGTGERALVAGVTADAGWRSDVVDAEGGVRSLPAATVSGLLDWSQAFPVPNGAPLVEVTYDGSARDRWLVLQLITLLVLVVMALPERVRSEADEDVDRPDAIDVDAAIVGEAP